MHANLKLRKLNFILDHKNLKQRLITCPSAIITKTWYWPPLCSTIVMAISIIGAKDVGPAIRWEKKRVSWEPIGWISRMLYRIHRSQDEQMQHPQVEAEGQFLCIVSALPQIHYKISLLNRNWKHLDHALMLQKYVNVTIIFIIKILNEDKQNEQDHDSYEITISKSKTGN